MFKPKLKEDEPMDTGEIACGGNEQEEGEIESDDEEVFWAEAKTPGNKFLVDPTSYGLPPSSIQELKKLSRAKRFGIPIAEGKTALVNTGLMTRLYKSLGIDENNEKQYRFNAVNMRGTQNMSSSDVLEYFTMYKPAEIEWINDVSCNVVWRDHFSAAKALLTLSKEIKNLDKIRFNANPFKRELESKIQEIVPRANVDAVDAVDARVIEGAIPPGYWRIGLPSNKSRTILMRFATRSDKKQRFAEKNSEYYKRHGNPHFGNIPGIVSSSLRNEVLRQYRQRLHNYSAYLQDKSKKNPWGYLAEEWARQEGHVDENPNIKFIRAGPSYIYDLRSSLNNRPWDIIKEHLGPRFQSSNSQNGNARGKFPKMKMYADEEAKLKITPLIVKRVPPENGPIVEDLRQRINRSRKRKQLILEEIKNKRVRFWNGPPDVKSSDDVEEEDNSSASDDDGGCTETEIAMEDEKGSDDDIDYNHDGKDVKDADFEIDSDVDEEKSSSWALENYSELKDSLTQDKNYKSTNDAKKPEKSKSNAEDKDGGDDDYDNDDDDDYDMDINDRSPLQIEFENDDYFENDSN